MEDHSDNDIGSDMASRIEQTLTAREQERLRERPVAVEATVADSVPKSHSWINVLMLMLGVFIGTLIGAAFYFFLPLPATENASNLPSVTLSEDIDKADRLLISGQGSPAKKAYLDIISQGASSPRPYNNLASLYASEGDLDQAQVLLKKALETNPDYLTVYRNVSMVYAAMARDSYGKALQLQGVARSVHLQPIGFTPVQPLLAAESVVPPIDTHAVSLEAEVILAETEKPEVQLATASVVEPAQLDSIAEKTPESVVENSPTEQTDAAEVLASEVLASVAAPQDALSEKNVSALVESVSPQDFLTQWALAWSSQDVDTYLQSYAADYSSAGSESSKLWREKRRKRVMAPSFIRIELEQIEILSQNEDSASVRVIQTYESDRYQDRTRKRFKLKRLEKSWVIVKESSLGRVR